MKFSISYDLNRPHQNYEALWDQLTKMNGKKILLSHWVVDINDSNVSASSLRDHFVRKGLVDHNDSLMVICLGPDTWPLTSETWADYNLLSEINGP